MATHGQLQSYKNSSGDVEDVKGNKGASYVLTGTAGGAASVVTLLSAVTSTGAGTSQSLPSGRCTFQAIANGTSGAFSATVIVQVSNDNTNWEDAITFSLSGTATTADSAGNTLDAPWAYVRGNVSAISGTGANVTLYMGV